MSLVKTINPELFLTNSISSQNMSFLQVTDIATFHEWEYGSEMFISHYEISQCSLKS
jgi:hypothetical protein